MWSIATRFSRGSVNAFKSGNIEIMEEEYRDKKDIISNGYTMRTTVKKNPHAAEEEEFSKALDFYTR